MLVLSHIFEKFQPRVDETLRWKVAPDPADPPDPPDPADPPDQVSSAAGSNHSNTRAGGEDYVSSNQTPSNKLPQMISVAVAVILDVLWL